MTGGDILLKMNLENLVKIDDIFDDGMVKKRLITKGSSTAKADNNSEIFFNFKIVNNNSGDELYRSSPDFDKDFSFTEDQRKDFEYLRNSNQCVRVYQDEYKISRMLRQTIKRMKKMETSDIIVKGFNYIKYGLDFDALAAKHEVGLVAELKYTVIFYTFTEDKSGFTMTIDEKLFHAQRKRDIALQQFSKGNFKRSQKVFEIINSYFDLGAFSEEERLRVKPLQLSSLLNTSLVMMKLNKWKEVDMVAGKILKLDKNNVKAIYRKALALKHLQDYEQAKKTILDFKDILEKDLELKLKMDPQLLADTEHLLTSIKQTENEYIKKQKQVYSSMFK